MDERTFAGRSQLARKNHPGEQQNAAGQAILKQNHTENGVDWEHRFRQGEQCGAPWLMSKRSSMGLRGQYETNVAER
jgi:hypothetical protein